MNVEQRLLDALRTVDRVEPSPDLWSRVLHSIDEDRAHRRRVATTVAVTLGAIVASIGVGLVGATDGPLGRFVRAPVMELIETVALVVVVAVLGPAIRRFGRGYAYDLWPATPETAAALLRLLDVAYALVFSGFILLTADFGFAGPPDRIQECLFVDATCTTWGEQVEGAMVRLGGLVLTMGLLHAVTIIVLPVLALISNSTRLGRALPRWLVVVLVVVGVGLGFQVVSTLIGVVVGLGGG